MKNLVHFYFSFFQFLKNEGLFGAFPGQYYAILRSYNPTKSSYRAIYLRICFGVGIGTEQSLHIGLLSDLRFFSYEWSFFTLFGQLGVRWAHFMAHVLLVGVPKRPTIMPRLIYIPNPIQKIPWSLIGDHEPILDYPTVRGFDFQVSQSMPSSPACISMLQCMDMRAS